MSRRASDANSVLSFTFLDVLMCTMGSLLLLLVVFGVIAKKATRARREGEAANITLSALTAPTPAHNGAEPAVPAKPADDSLPTDPVALAKALEELRQQQADLEQTKRKIADRRREQENLISHLEDHERRLEHDLGKLYVSLQALDAAESKRTTDRDQAAAEVKHLEEVIRDTEAQLDEMRKNGDKKKSFAIVPYKGANGTFRRPVFVECTADAVTIQPEGIRFTVEDFDGPLRSGNPLAAAIRAAHEELNARAVAAGQADMPDPYPLLIVRPDGAGAYAVAVSAIRSWDSDYGYEFVESDWKLKFPEPDPRLGQVMSHAVDQARQRQALLAKVAPMEYAPRLSGGGSGHGGGGGGDYAGGEGGGGGFDDLAGGGHRIGSHAGEGSMGGDGDGANALRAGGRYGGAGGDGNFSDEFAANAPVAVGAVSTTGPEGYGGGTGGPDGPGTGGGGREGPGSGAGGGDTNSATAAQGSGGPNAAGTGVGTRYGGAGAQGATAGSQVAANRNSSAPSGGPSAGAGGSTSSGAAGAGSGQAGTSANGGATQVSSASGASGAAGSAASGSATGSTASSGGANGSAGGGSGGNAGGGSVTVGSPDAQPVQVGARRGSAAEKRGANWANADAKRRVSAITRPIKVQVSAEQLAIIDGAGGAPAAGAMIVTFKQPTERMLDQLADAIRQQIGDWGLAGDDMYWRPMLVVQVTPGAERQATRLAELLENSGIDVRLPQTAARPAEGGGRATR